MDPVELLRLLLDPERLAVVGAVVGRGRSSAEVADRTGVDVDTVVRTLAPLVQAGLVVRHRLPGVADTYRVDAVRWRAVAQDLPRAPSLHPRVAAGMTRDERQVLARFFVGEHLPALPAQRTKRLVVLERLALEFEPGHRYVEPEVNAALSRFNDDHSTLRRALVDEGLLDREPSRTSDGRSTVVYWRAGGRL